MRRIALPLLVVALLLVTGFSGWLYLQNRNEKLAYQDLSASEEQSRQNYNKTLDAIAAIQDSLDAITPRDESLKSGSLATESRRERVLSSCASAGAMEMVVASNVENVNRIVHHG